MEQIQAAIWQMIAISADEIDKFLNFCTLKTFKKRALLSKPNAMINELYFINKGIARVTILDQNGTKHTTHFALENHFIADYASFILKEPSFYTLEALEETEVVILPRAAIEWGYKNLEQGDTLGRMVAEFYFIYNDMRIKNLYTKTPLKTLCTIKPIIPFLYLAEAKWVEKPQFCQVF
jgi:signal-transduction protein with cAMP-binding, CBS, and nucleotidyltransferase domain